MAIAEEQILNALRTVIDPDFRKDLVTLGMIKDLKVEGNDATFTVELTTPACPLRDKIESDCYAAVGKIAGIGKIIINMSARVRPQQPRGVEQLALPEVKNVVAIASGKGGVGKSTVSANVACALAQMGAK